MAGHIAAGADSLQAGGGAQTRPQALGPDKCKSCESAVLLSGGPPVPHPNLYDQQGSPQQMRNTGTTLGTPRSPWAGSKQYTPALEKTCVMLIVVLSKAPHSLLCLQPVLDRCHPAVFARGRVVHMWRDGPPMLSAHLSGIHLLMPMFSLAGTVHDSGQVPHLLAFILACRNPLLHPTLVDPFYSWSWPMTVSFPHGLKVSNFPFLTDPLLNTPHGQSFPIPG